MESQQREDVAARIFTDDDGRLSRARRVHNLQDLGRRNGIAGGRSNDEGIQAEGLPGLDD